MRSSRHGKDDRRGLTPNAHYVLLLVGLEIGTLGLFALAFFGGWYRAAFVLLVIALLAIPVIWLLLPLFRKR